MSPETHNGNGHRDCDTSLEAFRMLDGLQARIDALRQAQYRILGRRRKEPRGPGTNEMVLKKLATARGADEKSFYLEEFIRRVSPSLLPYLCKYLGNYHDAEEVLQNTFVQIYTKIDQYDPTRSAQSWYYAVATNQAIDLKRRRTRQWALPLDTSEDEDDGMTIVSILGETEEPVDALIAQEEERSLRTAVASLPDIFRDTMQLYLADKKYEDIALELGIPVGTVKSRMFIAKQRLEQILNNQLCDADA